MSSDDKKIREVLEEEGWNNFYTCSCPGGKKEHFKNPDFPKYEIITKPKTQTFRISLENKVIAGPFWGYQWSDKSKEYVIKS